MSTTAENSAKTTQVVGRPFAKGVSGNPGGRPKGLAAYVREQTLDGQELIDFALQVLRGEKLDGRKPTLEHRLEAKRWLADRGFGKALQQSLVELNDTSGELRDELSAMTLDEVLELRDDLLRGLEALPEGQVIDGEVVEAEVRDPA